MKKQDSPSHQDELPPQGGASLAETTGSVLPCPWCGVPGVTEQDDENQWWAMCGNEQCSWSHNFVGPCESLEAARSVWNKRAPAKDTIRLDYLQTAKPEIYGYAVAKESGGGENWIVGMNRYTDQRKWAPSLREAIDMEMMRRHAPNDVNFLTCPKCGGTGEVSAPLAGHPDDYVCPKCDGHGVVYRLSPNSDSATSG